MPSYLSSIHVHCLCALCSQDTRHREDAAIGSQVRESYAQQKLARQAKSATFRIEGAVTTEAG